MKNVDKYDKHLLCKLHINPKESPKSLFSPDLLSQSVTQQVFIEFLHVPDIVLGFGNAVVNKTVTSKQGQTDKKKINR